MNKEGEERMIRILNDFISLNKIIDLEALLSDKVFKDREEEGIEQIKKWAREGRLKFW